MTSVFTRQLLSTPSVLRLSFSAPSRNSHFLSSVPIKKRGEDGQLPKDYYEGKKPLVLYFSAGWCPSCRQLTPKLSKFYDTMKSRGLEIVWVSREKSAEDQVDYYERKLPEWGYIPFGDDNIRGFMDKYGVKTIPALRLVDENGEVLSEEVRKDVEENWKKDPEAIMDKWDKLTK